MNLRLQGLAEQQTQATEPFCGSQWIQHSTEAGPLKTPAGATYPNEQLLLVRFWDPLATAMVLSLDARAVEFSFHSLPLSFRYASPSFRFTLLRPFKLFKASTHRHVQTYASTAANRGIHFSIALDCDNRAARNQTSAAQFPLLEKSWVFVPAMTANSRVGTR